MPQKLIDQTTIQPDGKPGDDAFTAFATCNDNFQDAEARLVALEAGGGETGDRLDTEIAARTAADAALDARIDAEHSLITQEIADRIAAVSAEATARANADTALGLRIPGRNMLINGNMDFFQRGSSANRPNGESYAMDRWSFASIGSGTSNWGVGTFGLSDMLPVPSPPRYWMGVNVAANTTSAWVRQKIENVWTFHNGKATLSFWMRAGVAGKKVGVRIIQDYGAGSGASPAIFIEGPVFTLTTAFQKYTATFDVPSLVGKTVGAQAINDCLQVVFDFASTAGYGSQLANQTGLFEFTQVQFERGAVATDFDRRHDALELILCQRYYEVLPMGGGTGVTYTANGDTRGSIIPYKVAKRATPAITRSGTMSVVLLGNAGWGANIDMGQINITGDKYRALVSGISANLQGYGGAVVWGDNLGGFLTGYIDAEL